MIRKPYTEIDDFCIINFYNKIDIKLLVSALKRTKGSIRYRAIQLGVAKPIKRLTPNQKNFIDLNKSKLTQVEIADRLKVTRDAVVWHILYSNNNSSDG